MKKIFILIFILVTLISCLSMVLSIISINRTTELSRHLIDISNDFTEFLKMQTKINKLLIDKVYKP